MLYAYGEDAMTLYALTKGLDCFLQKLNDLPNNNKQEEIKKKDCCIFYRPSFGRGGPKAQGFGEFDAIIASKSQIYLIESKWQRENTKKTKFELAAPQVFRHVIFQWIYKQWNAWKQQKKNAEEKWSNFTECKECDYQDHLKTFHDAYESKPLPTAGKLLAENLQCVLKKLRDHFKKKEPTITNILLLFYEKKVVRNWNDDTLDKLSVTEKKKKSDKNKNNKLPAFTVVPLELTSTSMEFVCEQSDEKVKNPKLFELNLS